MKKHFIIFGAALIFYILAVNLFNSAASLSFSGDGTGQYQMITGGMSETANVADSVSLSILRKRWYGRVYETISGEDKISNLYLLGFAKLPLRNAGINYVFIHVLFFLILGVYASIVVAMKYKQYDRFRRFGY